MMLAVFGTMLLAYGLGRLDRPRLATGAATLSFGLAIWLFLFEIYSPGTGFTLPWLRW